MYKVSVIIPVYNVEKYLRECLDSVINQTLKDIEIICVNDGSTDNSWAILQELTAKNNRIILINQKNKGPAAARNAAMNISNGEFVCFLDPDDLYPDNDILETLYTKAKDNNVYICGGRFSEFMDGTEDIKTDYSGFSNGYVFKKDGIVKYEDYQFDYGYTRFIYNREFLKKNNIYFPNLRRYQDPPFFVKAMYTAKEFYALNKITYRYRCRPGHINWTKRKVNDCLEGLYMNMAFAKKHKLDKLSDYTYDRFCWLYNEMKESLDLCAKIKIAKCIKIEPRIKTVVHTLTLKKILQIIFSVKNSANRKHKIITILGIKIKIKRKNK